MNFDEEEIDIDENFVYYYNPEDDEEEPNLNLDQNFIQNDHHHHHHDPEFIEQNFHENNEPENNPLFMEQNQQNLNHDAHHINNNLFQNVDNILNQNQQQQLNQNIFIQNLANQPHNNDNQNFILQQYQLFNDLDDLNQILEQNNMNQILQPAVYNVPLTPPPTPPPEEQGNNLIQGFHINFLPQNIHDFDAVQLDDAQFENLLNQNIP